MFIGCSKLDSAHWSAGRSAAPEGEAHRINYSLEAKNLKLNMRNSTVAGK